LDTLFLTVDGRYLVGDQGDLAGDIQKADADDSELAEEEVDDDSEGRENLLTELHDGVASSLGDFSTNGSLGGELNTPHTLRSRNPMGADHPLIQGPQGVIYNGQRSAVTTGWGTTVDNAAARNEWPPKLGFEVKYLTLNPSKC